MEAKRILVLNYEYPPLGGGAGNATFFLSKEWGGMGITVDIITTWFSGLEEVSTEQNNVTVFRVKSCRKKMGQSNPAEMLSYVLSAYKKAVNLIAKHVYDLTIAFFSIPSGLTALKICNRFRVPYIVLLRGGDVPGFLPEHLSLLHTITMPLTKMVWKKAKCLIANSNRLCTLARSTAEKINRTVVMVPNGVDITIFKPVDNRGKTPFAFLFVGRFVNQKNLLYLLSQFELVNRQKTVQLILAGDGPEKEKIMRRIDDSTVLKDTVTMSPWVLKKDLPGIYQTAHCFVNPSTDEGMPNTVLEAMACGLPVIASNIGGNNELVLHGKNGFLFNLTESNSLSEQMIKIIDDTRYSSMAFNSRHMAQTRYSWNVSAKSIIKDYMHAI